MELYFIGYALSEEEKKPVDELRERIAGKFGVQAALKTVPHLTIVRPFESERRDALVEHMRSRAAQEKPFIIPLTKFAEFEKSRVWFMEPAQSKELANLHSEFRELAQNYWKLEQVAPEFGMRYHVTLSNKDVTHDVHQEIGEFLRGEKLPLTGLNISSVSLFKDRGEGQGWEVVETIPFGK